MATTERGILEGKVLPELQAIASSMGVQGFQRLRKADLIGAIIAKAQGVEFVPSSAPGRSRRGGAQASEGEAQAPEAAPAVPDQPELPGAGEVEASSTGPERRTRRRTRASADAEPATAPEVSGNGGQPSGGVPPATMTEPSSNGEVAQAAAEAPTAPAAEQPAPAAEASSGQAAEAGAPPATRTEGAQPEQGQGGEQQSQSDQQAQGGQPAQG
ncbi:MAG TPA: Rho termination factor N-terminal domain-containing protein, partial [Actinomycetota bacterium]|nr:Rho termination factor N-terminal domain-containing protein [Actinomycetota bacterium]